MPWSLLVSRPALYVYAAIALGLAYWGWHHHVWYDGYNTAVAEQTTASTNFNTGVGDAGASAVQGVIYANDADKPAVDLATDWLRSACSGVRSEGSSGVFDEAAREAEINRTLQDAADDVRTCQKELNRFAGLQAERAAVTALSRDK